MTGRVQGREEAALPEAVGRHAAHALLEEVSRGGAVDSEHQARRACKFPDNIDWLADNIVCTCGICPGWLLIKQPAADSFLCAAYLQ